MEVGLGLSSCNEEMPVRVCVLYLLPWQGTAVVTTHWEGQWATHRLHQVGGMLYTLFQQVTVKQ